MTATPIPLSQTTAGQRVRVSQIDAGQSLTARLSAMGLTPGVPVDVITVSGGPIVLQVLGSRLALGRGMAKKVLVRVTGKTPEK
jgi:ferrous iron transport protein A